MLYQSYSHVLTVLSLCNSTFPSALSFSFFFNDTATTEIYTLSLHDALPILSKVDSPEQVRRLADAVPEDIELVPNIESRSEEHTSELQSHVNLVCRLLLEKKKKKNKKKR